MFFKSWLVYLLTTTLTGNPLLGLLAIAALWYLGGSWWVGRLWNPLGPLQRWRRTGDLRDQLAQNPHNLNVRSELGAALLERRPVEARDLLAEVVRRAPELPLPRYQLGLARLATGDEAGAADIEAAVGLRGDLRFGEPWVRLGDHHLAAGRPREAYESFRRATEVHGSYAEAWYKAGLAAIAFGDLAAARSALSETLASTEGAPAYKRRQDRRWRWQAAWRLRRLG